MRTNLCIDFVHLHMRDTIVIIEGVNRPHPHFPACDILFSWDSINQCHPKNALCL